MEKILKFLTKNVIGFSMKRLLIITISIILFIIGFIAIIIYLGGL